ncbi:hypothetical protein IP88_09200 [alpha proteobacterium AAP81b]|nr:hypothetical protein IP88_09200 [alpha proteobacterium AAP81b]
MPLCLALAAPAFAAPPPDASWQALIRPDDRKRLTGLWRAWTRAVGEVHQEGADLDALGALGDPGAARAGLPPPPGRYRCRLVRLGRGDAAPSGMPVVGELPGGACTVTAVDGGLWFEQLEGPQRVAGKLWADGERQVFLGSIKLAGEAGVMAYGDDRARDQVGVLRAIGEGRWRLELPWPRWQSDLCLVEIVAG